VGQHSLKHRQSYSSNDLRDGSVAETEQAHRIKHTGHVVASGRGGDRATFRTQDQMISAAGGRPPASCARRDASRSFAETRLRNPNSRCRCLLRCRSCTTSDSGGRDLRPRLVGGAISASYGLNLRFIWSHLWRSLSVTSLDNGPEWWRPQTPVGISHVAARSKGARRNVALQFGRRGTSF